jgi:hypothetical protein
MFSKFRFLVFFISLLGLSLSSCQKEAIYTPGGPEAIENSDASTASDEVSNLPEDNLSAIIDPDAEDDEDDEEVEEEKDDD